ncbi:MAG: NAD(P)-dependent oxidoreductase [Elainellaceae cyanobacterium]
MTIGLIGTGLMGQPMALRLKQAGFNVAAYNRTRSKLELLEKEDIELADSVLDLVKRCDCVVLMVTNAEAIASLVLTDEVKSHLKGCTILQMSTISPEQSQAIRDEVVAAGGEYVEAPVLGSIPQANDGSLQIMVGATPEQFGRLQPVLQCLGSEPIHTGEVGTAAATKLAMNQLIGSLTTAFSLSLGLVQQAGIDIDKFMSILRQSALYAPTFDKKLQRMVERNFENPNFPAKHLLKDMRLFIETAEHHGIDASLVESVAALVQKAMNQGLADSDYSALYAAVNPVTANLKGQDETE